MSLNTIQDKVVLVTGGASGIGYHISNTFLSKGAKKVIIVDLLDNKDAIIQLKHKHGENKVVFYKGDVTDEAFLETFFKEVGQTVAVLVNNAGIVDELNWRKCIEVNTMAVINWTLKFFHCMRKDKGGNGGTIINISSIFGFRGCEFVPIYSASKFAVLGFSKCLGHDYNHNLYGVRVMALCPGFTKTDLAMKTPADKICKEEQRYEDFTKYVDSCTNWQEADAVGRAAAEVFESAASGTAWLIEGDEPISLIS